MRANTANAADCAKYANKAGELDEEADVLQKYIRKDIDDTAHGTITFEKVQKFLQGLAIGESGKHYIDKNGAQVSPTLLLTAFMMLPLRLQIELLLVLKVSTSIWAMTESHICTSIILSFDRSFSPLPQRYER